MNNLDIQISKIECNLDIQDIYGATNERIFQLNGYKIEYYLNKYIKSTIDISTDKELTIDEIKDKIRETYRGVQCV